MIKLFEFTSISLKLLKSEKLNQMCNSDKDVLYSFNKVYVSLIVIYFEQIVKYNYCLHDIQ